MLDQIDVALTFVSSGGVILYRNQAAARRPSPAPRDVGVNIDTCHEKSESLADIDRIFADFRNGRREPLFYIGSRLGRAGTSESGADLQERQIRWVLKCSSHA
jgi:hypothetical protein